MLAVLLLLVLCGRQRVLGQHPEWAPNVRIGVSTNYNKLCGMGACDKPTPGQKAAMQALYNAVDFVGMSAYPRFKGDLADMEDATQILDYEFKVSIFPYRLCATGVWVPARKPSLKHTSNPEGKEDATEILDHEFKVSLADRGCTSVRV